MKNREMFDKLLVELKGLELIQNGEFLEDVPEDMYNKYIKDNYKEVCFGLDVDTHRWYETSIMVVEIYGYFLGIRWVTNLFSESSSYEDIGWKYWFEEMEAVQVTSYVKKEGK